MPELNTANCYKIPVHSSWPLETSSLPENWLSLLVSYVQPDVEKQAYLHDYYIKQILPTYTHYLELTDNLKSIFNYVISQGANPLIITQMPKEIDELHCTSGFHNRIQYVFQLINSPSTLDDLTAAYRKDIVDYAARAYSDDIHTHNLFFIIARNAGFGVWSINEQDAFIYTEFETTIYDLLSLAFKEKYTFSQILIDCYNRLRSKAAEFGYSGDKSTTGGYKLDEYNKISDFIKQICPSLNLANCLIMNSESLVVDINWLYIKHLLFTELQNKEYFIFNTQETKIIADLETILAKSCDGSMSLDLRLEQMTLYINKVLLAALSDENILAFHKEVFTYIKYFFEIDDRAIFNKIDFLSLASSVKTMYQLDFLLGYSIPEHHPEIMSRLNLTNIIAQLETIDNLNTLLLYLPEHHIRIFDIISAVKLSELIRSFQDLMIILDLKVLRDSTKIQMLRAMGLQSSLHLNPTYYGNLIKLLSLGTNTDLWKLEFFKVRGLEYSHQALSDITIFTRALKEIHEDHYEPFLNWLSDDFLQNILANCTTILYYFYKHLSIQQLKALFNYIKGERFYKCFPPEKKLTYIMANCPVTISLQILENLDQDAIERYIVNIRDLTTLIENTNYIVGISIINKLHKDTLLSFVANYTAFTLFFTSTFNSDCKIHILNILGSELISSHIDDFTKLKYVIQYCSNDPVLEKILILLGSRKLLRIIKDGETLIDFVNAKRSMFRTLLHIINPINLKKYITDSHFLYNLIKLFPFDQHQAILGYVVVSDIPIKITDYNELMFVLENYSQEICTETLRSFEYSKLKLLFDNPKKILILLGCTSIHKIHKKIILQSLLSTNPIEIIPHIFNFVEIINTQLIDPKWKIFLLKTLPNTYLVDLLGKYNLFTDILTLTYLNSECKEYLFGMMQGHIPGFITTTEQLKYILNNPTVTFYYKMRLINTLTGRISSDMVTSFADLVSLFTGGYIENQCKIKILEILASANLPVIIGSPRVSKIKTLRDLIYNDDQKLVLDQVCAALPRPRSVLSKRPRDEDASLPEISPSDQEELADVEPSRPSTRMRIT